MTTTKIFTCIAIFILSACIFTISSVEARIGFSDVVFAAEAAPGGHVSHNLVSTLSSDEPAPVNLSVDILDWYQNQDGANLGLKDNPEIAPYSAKKILSVSPRNFSISPGKSQNIKIEADMPAGEGGRYAIIFVHTLPKLGKGGQGVAITVGMNTLVLLTISGSELIKTGEIDNLTLQEPISAKQQNISMTFKNTGNYHYPVNASATLKDAKGSVLATASTAVRSSIIPTAKRMIKFSIVPESLLKPGTYTAEVNVTLKDGTLLATKKTLFDIKS